MSLALWVLAKWLSTTQGSTEKGRGQFRQVAFFHRKDKPMTCYMPGTVQSSPSGPMKPGLQDSRMHPQSSPSGPQGDGPRLHILQASGGAAPSIWNALRSSSAKRRVLHFRFMCLTLKKLSQHHSTKEVKPSLTPRGPRSPTVNPQAWPSLGTQHSLFSLIWCECFSDIFLPQSVNSMKRKPMPVCVHLCPFVLLFKANRHSEIESNPSMTPAAKAAGVP